MTNEQAKSELMQIYGMLSEEKKQALDVLMAQNCDQCEVGNPCLYCKHEFKAQADGEYISREALLEDLYKRDYTKFTHRDFVALVQYQDIVAIPSAEPKWIPVSERLPEEFESVLVCYKSQGGMAQAVSERFGTHTGYKWSALAGIEPIAWMPLPKPYEPQESEDKE